MTTQTTDERTATIKQFFDTTEPPSVIDGFDGTRRTRVVTLMAQLMAEEQLERPDVEVLRMAVATVDYEQV